MVDVQQSIGWTDAPGQFDPFAFALLNNNQEQDCALGFCEALRDAGPPPDDILYLPPPPIPPQFAHLLQAKPLANKSASSGCSLCDSFAGTSTFSAAGRSETGLTAPTLNRTQTDHESWLSLLVASILASSVLGTVCILMLAWCRRWKPFPVASCQMLTNNLLGTHGTSKVPPNCGSTTDSCVSPVVNEKSPQSIITSSPCKRNTTTTIIPSKYWRTSRCPMDLHSPSQQTPLEQSASTTELDEYNTGCGETASCTSSPVYAELDAHQQITQLLQQQQQQQHHQQQMQQHQQFYHHPNQYAQQISEQPSMTTQISAAQLTQTIPFGTNSLLNTYAEPTSNLCVGPTRSNCTQIRLSGTGSNTSNASATYAVHTYSELPEPVRVNRIVSQAPLLPDVSYDNAAYLPSSTGDHHLLNQTQQQLQQSHSYQNRSLRRQRSTGNSTPNQLGSTTPLLASGVGYYGNTMHSHMTTGNRSSKKQRSYLMQHLPQQQLLNSGRMSIASPATLVALRTDLNESDAVDHQPKYVQTSGRGRLVHEVYNDVSGGESSPSVGSSRTLSYKDQTKNRPLPPVPGVRL